MLRTLQHAPATHWLAWATLLGLACHLAAGAALDASYAESRFPVPYHEAQLSFSAEKLKAWYAFMQSKGTLGIYLRTQHLDFIFIASVLWLHAAALLWLSRLYAPGSRGRRWLVWAAVFSALAPLSDALENLVSYGTLADPQGFAPGLALVYSGFAAVKFGAFTATYAVAAVALLLGLVLKARHGLQARRTSRGTITP